MSNETAHTHPACYLLLFCAENTNFIAHFGGRWAYVCGAIAMDRSPMLITRTWIANEFRKINYVEMVDTVLDSLCNNAFSVATATYSKCLFMLPFKILQVVCAFYYFFTFLLRLIFIFETERKYFSLSVQHAHARIYKQDTNRHILTQAHTVMMMVFRLNYLDGTLVQCLSFYCGH